MKYKVHLLSVVIVSLLALACDVRREATGSYNKIIVFADAADTSAFAASLRAAVEKPIVTPRDEKIFTIEFVDTTKLERLTNSRNSIIAASLDSRGPAGDFIRNALSKEAQNAIATGSEWVVAKENIWAEGQMTLILSAPTAEDLDSRLFLEGEAVFRLLNNSVNERVSQWLFGKVFGKDEKLALEDSIAADYGFAIRIPRFWEWEKGSGEERFMWLRTLEPERWVFVWWTPLDSAMDFSVERWRAVRDSLCAIYYEGDIVSENLTPETTGVYIGGRPAVQIRALWENPKNTLGGPILSYVLSEPLSNRLYIVDGSLFAPIVKKEPYLRHIEIICRSFRSDVPKFYEERKARK